MAEEKPSGSPWEPLIWLVAILVGLAALIWVRGGWAALRSQGDTLFVNPPTTPTSPVPTSDTPYTNQ